MSSISGFCLVFLKGPKSLQNSHFPYFFQAKRKLQSTSTAFTQLDLVNLADPHQYVQGKGMSLLQDQTWKAKPDTFTTHLAAKRSQHTSRHDFAKLRSKLPCCGCCSAQYLMQVWALFLRCWCDPHLHVQKCTSDRLLAVVTMSSRHKSSGLAKTMLARELGSNPM